MKSQLALSFIGLMLILSACQKREFTKVDEPTAFDSPDNEFPLDPGPTTTTTTTVSTTSTTVLVTTTTLPATTTTTTLPPVTTTTLPVTTTTTLPPTTTTTLPPTTTTTLPPPVAMNTDFTVTSSMTPSDIVVIVDNSSQMWGPLRESIPDRFQNFMTALHGTNFRLAVTTGDAVGPKDYEAGHLTRILRSPVPGPGIALVPTRNFLDGSLGNAESSYFLSTIMRPEAICIQVGTHMCPNPGSGYQEPLQALSLFLNNPQGFLRPNSDLHVVIVSGQDEGSGSTRPEVIARPQGVVNQFNTMYPNQRLKIHTVVRQPGARCFGGEDFREAPTLSNAATLTGGDQVNICDESNANLVTAISQKVKPTLVFTREFDLSCDPIDMNNDGSPDVRVTDLRTGANVAFVRSQRHITIPGVVTNSQEFRASYHCKP